MEGSAQRVPVATGSITILNAVVEKTATIKEINDAIKAAADHVAFSWTEDQIVSSDTIGMTYGSLFDCTQTTAQDLGNGQTLVKVAAWYDNENSYTTQMVRTIKYVAELK
jgi:glyceraldehyde 3-phosphate dehydrogenase